MKKPLLATGLAAFAVLTIAYADDKVPSRAQSDQVHTEHQPIHEYRDSGMSIEQVIVKKLMKANEGEIDLGKFAQQHSSSQEVKDLAQHLINDHQNMNQDLQKLEKTVVHHREAANSTASSNNNRDANRTHTNSNMTAMVPKEMCQIGDKACENNLVMTKDMLNQYQGQDFDMAYLGQQCVAHMMTLAELRAIETEGPQELQKMASEASVKVQEHLNMIKELSKKLASGLKASNS